MKSYRRVRFEPKENGIHVANLPPTVTTDFIKSLFSESGQVINVVLKQKPTSCFAFVDFALKEEAEAAVRDFNYTKLNGESIIVTRTTSEIVGAIQSGQGNLFIRGLDPTIDCLQLHELFSSYGEIISCRIPTINGTPRGFAYVQFLRQEDAERAQKELADSTVNGKPIQIGPFLKRADRPQNAALMNSLDSSFTNVYIKNLPESISTLLSLIKLFSEFGDVLSARIVAERRVGYVMMSDHDSAVRAVVGLCGRTIFGSRISCCRSLSAAERASFVKKVIEGPVPPNVYPAPTMVQQQEATPQNMEEGKPAPVFQQNEAIDPNTAAVFQANSAFGQAPEYKKSTEMQGDQDTPQNDSKKQQKTNEKVLTLPNAAPGKSFEVPIAGQDEKKPRKSMPIKEKAVDRAESQSSAQNPSEPEPEPASESQSEHDAEEILPTPPKPTNTTSSRPRIEYISSSEDDRPKPSPSNPFV